mmetsp:Transcript_21927/g.47850  ORF Transcript_21927/g.47850 Transcript_21927/m.47850 type:complete len:260 (+) Transcript_21927:1757-2536(+)
MYDSVTPTASAKAFTSVFVKPDVWVRTSNVSDWSTRKKTTEAVRLTEACAIASALDEQREQLTRQASLTFCNSASSVDSPSIEQFCAAQSEQMSPCPSTKSASSAQSVLARSGARISPGVRACVVLNSVEVRVVVVVEDVVVLGVVTIDVELVVLVVKVVDVVTDVVDVVVVEVEVAVAVFVHVVVDVVSVVVQEEDVVVEVAEVDVDVDVEEVLTVMVVLELVEVVVVVVVTARNTWDSAIHRQPSSSISQHVQSVKL